MVSFIHHDQRATDMKICEYLVLEAGNLPLRNVSGDSARNWPCCSWQGLGLDSRLLLILWIFIFLIFFALGNSAWGITQASVKLDTTVQPSFDLEKWERIKARAGKFIKIDFKPKGSAVKEVCYYDLKAQLYVYREIFMEIGYHREMHTIKEFLKKIQEIEKSGKSGLAGHDHAYLDLECWDIIAEYTEEIIIVANDELSKNQFNFTRGEPVQYKTFFDEKWNKSLTERVKQAFKHPQLVSISSIRAGILESVFGKYKKYIIEYRNAFSKIRDLSESKQSVISEQIDILGMSKTEKHQNSRLQYRSKDLEDQLKIVAEEHKYAKASYKRADVLISQLDKIMFKMHMRILTDNSFKIYKADFWGQAFTSTNSKAFTYESTNAYSTCNGSCQTNKNTKSNSSSTQESQPGSEDQNNSFSSELRNWAIAFILMAGVVLVLQAHKPILRARKQSFSWAFEKLKFKFTSNAKINTRVFECIITVFDIIAIMAFFSILEYSKFLLLNSIMWSLIFLRGASFIGSQLFSDLQEDDTPLGIKKTAACQSRSAFFWLFVSFGANNVLLGAYEYLRSSFIDFLNMYNLFLLFLFPITLVGAFFLTKIGKTMDSVSQTAKFDYIIMRNFQKPFAIILRLILPVVLIASLMGYMLGTSILVKSTILTLGLFHAIFFLEILVSDLFHEFFPEYRMENTIVKLFFILIKFLIIILTFYSVIFIWLGGVFDIKELYLIFVQKILIERFKLSLADIFVFCVVFLTGCGVTWLMNFLLFKSIPRRAQNDDSGSKTAVLWLNYSGILFSLIIALLFVARDFWGMILIIFGTLWIGFSFGLRAVASNFVSGLILLLKHPIKVGDFIEVDGVKGTVENISTQSTTVRTLNHGLSEVPNTILLTKSIIKPKSRKIL